MIDGTDVVAACAGVDAGDPNGAGTADGGKPRREPAWAAGARFDPGTRGQYPQTVARTSAIRLRPRWGPRRLPAAHETYLTAIASNRYALDTG
ncbi:hypothetical protein MKOR_31150 [Mycolicibacillus koreensis]|nr:hypothetical protein MKOR_31150 [Mycolicibacillus koreensis]